MEECQAHLLWFLGGRDPHGNSIQERAVAENAYDSDKIRRYGHVYTQKVLPGNYHWGDGTGNNLGNCADLVASGHNIHCHRAHQTIL